MADDKTKTDDVWDDLEFEAELPTDDTDEGSGLETESGQEESEVEQDTEPDTTDEEPTNKKAPSPLTKAEKAIIAWKRTASAKDARLKEAEEELRKYKSSERKTTLAKKYEDEGHDPETALKLATSETEKEYVTNALEDIKFITANQAVLGRYPEASNELPKIREAMKATGKSAGEVCAFLFSSDNRFEAKARADALSTARGTKSSAAGAAVSSTIEQSEEGLTSRMEEARSEFEKMLGRKLTGKEVKEIMSRANGRKGRSYDIN